MLTANDIAGFFNKLEFAGLKPPGYAAEFKKGMLEDFAQRYAAKLSGEELRLAADLLQTSEEWPSYKQIEETLRAIRTTEETDTSSLYKDAYPDGEFWQDLAREFGKRNFPAMEGTDLEYNLLALYWLLQVNKTCQNCKGYDCQFYGHRPYLRLSQNNKELYKCCNVNVCAGYKGYGRGENERKN